MIEPTDEMRRAFLAEREDSCDELGCGRADCLNVRLAAVLATVARDRCMEPRGHGPRRHVESSAEGWDWPVVHQAVAGDDHVQCCGTAVGPGVRSTLNPHAVTCRGPS